MGESTPQGSVMGVTDARLYKTCFVVPDLAAEAQSMSALFGFEWIEVPALPYEFRIGQDIRTLVVNALITRQRPRIHLIEALPGTPWQAGPAGAAHHIAYWVNDIDDATHRMLRAGFVIECSDSLDPEGPKQWAYFVNAAGVRFELLEAAGSGDPEAGLDALPSFIPLLSIE